MADGSRTDAVLFPSLRGYQAAWLRHDILAGVTIGAIAIPGQIAVAKLAGMPPATGLWAYVLAGIVACIFVANRVLLIAADSTTAPLIFAGLSIAAVPASENYVRLAVTLALMIGAMLIVVAIFRLQWIADLLSRPVIVGFMAGVAVTIVIGELGPLLGIPTTGSHALEKLWSLLSQLGSINWVTTLIGVASLALLALCTRINRKLPGALLVIIVATLATALLDLTAYNVAVLGAIDTGLPHPVLPDFSIDSIRVVLPTALAITLISLAQTAATSRSSADAGDFRTSLRADLGGLGAANVASAGVGAFSVDGSPGSTAVMQSSGARSQLGGLIGALLVLGILLFAGGMLTDLPSASLAAVMILISVRIINVAELRRIRAFSTAALALTVVTFLAVVVLGVEMGVLIAIMLALINRAVKSARPEIIELGRRPDGHWLPSDLAPITPKIVAYRLNGPLWFANASWFHDEIKARLDDHHEIQGVIIDTTGIDDLDFTGASVMIDVMVMLRSSGVESALVMVAGMTQDALTQIRINEVVPNQHVYDSVEDAFQAMRDREISS